MSVDPSCKTAAARVALGLAPVVHDDVIVMVCHAFRLTREQLMVRTRKAPIARARFIVCWVLFHRPKPNGTFRTLPEVARMVGLKDHSSIIHACVRAKEIAAQEPAYRAVMDHIAAGSLAPVAVLDGVERDGIPLDQTQFDRRKLREAARQACQRSRTRRGERLCEDDSDAHGRAMGSISLLEALAAAWAQQVAA